MYVYRHVYKYTSAWTHVVLSLVITIFPHDVFRQLFLMIMFPGPHETGNFDPSQKELFIYPIMVVNTMNGDGIMICQYGIIIIIPITQNIMKCKGDILG